MFCDGHPEFGMILNVYSDYILQRIVKEEKG